MVSPGLLVHNTCFADDEHEAPELDEMNFTSLNLPVTPDLRHRCHRSGVNIHSSCPTAWLGPRQSRTTLRHGRYRRSNQSGHDTLY